MDIDNNVGNNGVSVDPHNASKNLLDIFVRAILNNKGNNVVEVEDHSRIHQEDNETISQPSPESVASVVTEEEKETSKTHQEEDNPEEGLHTAIADDNLVTLDQTVSDDKNDDVVGIEDHSRTHQEGNETISQLSSESVASVATEEEKEVSETHQSQGLLDMIIRAISGNDNSKSDDVVGIEDHSRIHQEGNETISQPSPESVASIVTEEEKETSKTHQEEDNPEKGLHTAIADDNPVTLDQTVSDDKSDDVVGIEDHSRTHQEDNETISQPSPESVASIVTEEEEETSKTYQEEDKREEGLHTAIADDNPVTLDQTVSDDKSDDVVGIEDHSRTHQEGNETISQPSSAIKEDLQAIVNAVINNDRTVDFINKVLCPVSELVTGRHVHECQNVDLSKLLDNNDGYSCFNFRFVEYNHFLIQENTDNNATNSII